MARTANRGTISASAPTSYNAMRWRLGKYIRLSKEDLLRGRDESNSVINQRRLLEQYHQTHLDEFYDGTEQDVYVDDGKTGTDTDREDFQRLLADVYSGRINCVIVKDLSRLSRNYTDAGNLIENLFVRLNVRFISLAEGVDSYRNPDSVSNIIVPITNVMKNMSYSGREFRYFTLFRQICVQQSHFVSFLQGIMCLSVGYVSICCVLSKKGNSPYWCRA